MLRMYVLPPLHPVKRITSNTLYRFTASEKSLEKEQYNHDDRNEQYYGDYDQSENYKPPNSYSKRSKYVYSITLQN